MTQEFTIESPKPETVYSGIVPIKGWVMSNEKPTFEQVNSCTRSRRAAASCRPTRVQSLGDKILADTQVMHVRAVQGFEAVLKVVCNGLPFQIEAGID